MQKAPEKEYIYDAFISYRHTAHDKAIAERLQKQLESYRPPKSVKHDFKRWRVFRDETELPTSSNLSDDIKTALENSRYLIVICSETTKDSRWCMEEITYFKELHNGNNANIITVLAEGEPDKVFPAALCNELIEVTDADGNVSYQSHVIEPLAANIAAPTLAASLRKLKTEFLRIAAPLLGCGFDTLYNRNHRRTVQRIIIIAALIFTFLLAFGAYTGAMLYEINEQKTALEEKTRELDESNRVLSRTNADLEKKTREAEENFHEAERQRKEAEKNLREAEKQKSEAEKNFREAEHQRAEAEKNFREAERQRKEAERNLAEANRQRTIAETNEKIANEQAELALKENSEVLVGLSNTHMANGDGIAAIDAAISALPSAESPRPLVLSAKRTLANHIGAFKQTTFKNSAKITCEGAIEEITLAGGGKTIVARDNTGLYFFSAESGELIKKYDASFFGGYTYDLYFDNTGEIETISLEKASGTTFVTDNFGVVHGYRKSSPDKNLSESDLIITYSNHIKKLNGVTGEIMWETALPEFSSPDISVYGNEIAVITSDEPRTGFILTIYDRKSGTLIRKLHGANHKLGSFPRYLASSDKKVFFADDTDGYLIKYLCFDVEGSSLSNPETIYDVRSDYEKAFYSDIAGLHTVGDVMYITSFISPSVNTMQLRTSAVNLDSGKELWVSYDATIAADSFFRSGYFDSKACNNAYDMLFVQSGKDVLFFNPESGTLLHKVELESIAVSSSVSADGAILTVTENGKEFVITAWNQTADNPAPAVFLTRTLESKSPQCAYYSDCYALVGEGANKAYVYRDVKNADFTKILNNADITEVAQNSTNTHSLLCGYSNILSYNNLTGELIPVVSTENRRPECLLLNDRKVIVENDNVASVYDITTGKECASVTLPDKNEFSYATVFAGKAVYISGDKLVFIDENAKISETSLSNNGKKVNITYTSLFSDGDKKLILKTSHFESNNLVYQFRLYENAFTSPVVLDIEMGSDFMNDLTIKKAVWFENNRVALLLSDGTVAYIDTKTGKCLNRSDFGLPSILSVMYIGEDAHIGVLCKNSMLYKVSLADGAVKASIDIANSNIKSATSDRTRAQYIPEEHMLALGGWQIEFGLDHTYLIDLDQFEICYDISGMKAYLPNDRSVLCIQYDVVGKFPLYTTEELTAKAKNRKGE